ncbi:hypothetical protein BDZ97DRAFT_1921039 [Flammula alnicola]|nr:hypothetical protein BDZ97DRAFT_1921039 [Flammula alnicola]
MPGPVSASAGASAGLNVTDPNQSMAGLELCASSSVASEHPAPSLLFPNSIQRINIQDKVWRLGSVPWEDEVHIIEQLCEALAPLLVKLKQLKKAAEIPDKRPEMPSIDEDEAEFDEAAKVISGEETLALAPQSTDMIPVEWQQLSLPSNGNVGEQHLGKQFELAVIKMSIRLGMNLSSMPGYIRDATDLRASTAIVNPNITGSTSLRLSWLWHIRRWQRLGSVPSAGPVVMASASDIGATGHTADADADFYDTDPATLLESKPMPKRKHGCSTFFERSWFVFKPVIQFPNAHNPQFYLLGYVGVVTAIGQVVEVPILMRSLADSLAHVRPELLPLPFHSSLLVVLDAGIAADSPTALVPMYAYDWWNSDA